MQLDETSFDSIQKIIDVSEENESLSLWEAPERMGDTVLREAEVETKAKP